MSGLSNFHRSDEPMMRELFRNGRRAVSARRHQHRGARRRPRQDGLSRCGAWRRDDRHARDQAGDRSEQHHEPGQDRRDLELHPGDRKLPAGRCGTAPASSVRRKRVAVPARIVSCPDFPTSTGPTSRCNVVKYSFARNSGGALHFVRRHFSCMVASLHPDAAMMMVRIIDALVFVQARRVVVSGSRQAVVSGWAGMR